MRLNNTIAMSKFILAIGAIIVFGGGLAFASAQAAPGDVLYGVRTGVFEKLGDLFTVSKHAQANRDVRIAERRLIEAVEMTRRREATAETLARITADLNMRMERVLAFITEYKTAGREEDANLLAVNAARILTHHSRALITEQADAEAKGEPSVSELLNPLIAEVTRWLTQAAVAATGQTTLE